jgi:HSP90 family molecular chaperone
VREIQSKSALLVNMDNDIIRFIMEADEDLADMMIGQLFDLALMSQGALGMDDVESFVCRSERLLRILTGRQAPS